MSETIVIVGGGHAGGQAVDSLRRGGFAGRLVLVSEEPYLPYHRPPLSKAYLAGQLVQDRLFLRHRPFYDQHDIELRLGVRVTAIDRERRRLRLSNDEELNYDQLMLGLGARVRTLSCPGASLPGVLYLRTIDDVNRIRERFAGGQRLVVVGAGYIGLEVAATARQQGLEVTVVEMADRCMNRVVAPVVAEFFAARHAREGVHILCNTTVEGFQGRAHVEGVLCSGKRVVPADFVVVGVGILPETTLAASAGLACDNGIIVDEQCRTSDSLVFAAGDCTNHPSVHYGRRVRLESVDNALEQAKTAAKVMLGGDARHQSVPWFWSDQYDVKLQIAGLSEGHDSVVIRGEPAAGQFSAWYLRDGELLATDAINRPGEFMLARRWIAERRRPDPQRLADPSIELKAV